MATKVTTQLIQKMLDEKFGKDEYSLMDEYKDSKTTLTIKHNKCGTKFKKLYRYISAIQSKCICPECNYLQKPRDPNHGFSWTEEDIKARIKDDTNDEYELTGVFESINKNTKMRHKTCGNEYSVKLSNFLQGKRCPYCAGSMKKTEEDIQEYLDENYFGKFKVVGKYIDKDTPLRIRHSDCGKEIKLTWNNIREGRFGCKHCQMSLGELVIKYILQKHHIKFDFDIRFEECKDINYLYFDFYIELGDEQYIIECDGRQHRLPIFEGDHGFEETLKINKRHDYIKDEFCKKYGINLLRIPFGEHHNTKEIEKQIVDFLGI